MKSLIATAAAMVVLGAGAARADLPALSIDAEVGYVTYGYEEGTITTNSLHVFGTATDGVSVASTASSPGGSVFASAPLNGDFASASLIYSAEVESPTNIVVPVRLYYSLFVKNLAAGSVHNASAEVDIEYAVTGAYDQLYTANYTSDRYDSCSGCATPGYLAADVEANTPFKIVLAVDAFGAEAYADPKLVIDSTWAASNRSDASGLSLSFSDGITNGLGNFTSGVPEPTGWALMITGLFGVGAMTRRRFALARQVADGLPPL